jgi:cobalamin synthase
MVVKILILRRAFGVIAISLLVLIAALSWVSDDLETAIVIGTASVLSIIGMLIEARTHYHPKGTRLKLWVIFIRASCILMLIVGIAALIKALVSDYPLHIILTCVWLIIVGGGFWILRIENELYYPH